MSAFQSALANGDLEAIRRVPKSDLHNHFFLGGNRALVSKWVDKDIAPLDRRLISMSEMHEWVQGRLGALFEGSAGRLSLYTAGLFSTAELDQIRQNGLRPFERRRI
jgi:hypothetical protein